MGLTDRLAAECHAVNQQLAGAFRRERPEGFLLVSVEEFPLQCAYGVRMAIRRGVLSEQSRLGLTGKKRFEQQVCDHHRAIMNAKLSDGSTPLAEAAGEGSDPISLFLFYEAALPIN